MTPAPDYIKPAICADLAIGLIGLAVVWHTVEYEWRDTALLGVFVAQNLAFIIIAGAPRPLVRLIDRIRTIAENLHTKRNPPHE